VIGRARHLHDNGLFDCYLAERHRQPIDPPTAEHLADCEACAARYAELAKVMDGVRAEGDAEADAIFTPERLRAQHHQVARRIETVARPARVISFPLQVVGRTITTSTSRTAPRWVAAAATAGLFVGIALGASYEWDWHGRGGSPLMASRGSLSGRALRLAPAPARGSAVDAGADDAFLSELELALERPRTRELAAVDAFTPHVREVRDFR